MYDSLMESEERRDRLRCRNQHDRDRRATESTQQREAWLARQRVRDRAHRTSQSAAQRESFGSQERVISVTDSRPKNESSRVRESVNPIETTSKRPDSVLHS